MKSHGIVLAPQSLKKQILSKKVDSLDNNFKIIDKETLVNHLCFTYDERAIIFLSRQGIRFENCKEYLEAMSFINLEEKYDESFLNDKIKQLISLKKELLRYGFIKESKLHREFYKNKKILVDGYHEKDVIINNLKDKFKLDIEYSFEKVKPLKMHNFAYVEEEIRYLFENIFNLYNKGISLNQIKVVADLEDYRWMLKKYQSFYNIHFNFKNDLLYFNTDEYRDFKNLILTSNIEEGFKIAYEKYDTPYLEKLLNKYIELKNEITNIKEEKFTFTNDELIKYFDYQAKNIHLEDEVYENGIDIITLDQVNKEDYVFLLGFNMQSYPKIYKDDDFLSDLEKSVLGIPTSIERQSSDKACFINNMYRVENLKISYSEKFRNTKYIESLLKSELDIASEKYIFEQKFYSKRHLNYFMGMAFDDQENFSIKYDYDKSITRESINYREYNPNFKRFESQNENNNLKLAYTSIDGYIHCPFKFYLNYILNVDSFESNVHTLLGVITHKIFEDYFNGIDKEFEDYLKEYNLKSSEEVVLKSNKEIIYYALDNFKNFYQQCLLENVKPEQKDLEYITSKNDKLIGSVDLIMYNATNYAMIDFKTGSETFNADKIKETGSGLQLPIYYLLVSSSDEFKDKKLSGLYYYNLIDPSYYSNDYKYLLFKGTTITDRDLDIVGRNYIATTGRSKKHVPLGEDKLQELMDSVKQYIENTCEEIRNNNFPLTMKKERKEDCKKCKMKEICYKNLIKNSSEEEGNE